MHTSQTLQEVSNGHSDDSEAELVLQTAPTVKEASTSKSSKSRTMNSAPQASQSSRSTSKGGKAKEKGKAKVARPSSGQQKNASEPKLTDVGKGRRGGRKPGASSYNEKDLVHLVALVGDILPTGGQGWEAVVERYNLYAKANFRTERTDKSLRKKFQEV